MSLTLVTSCHRLKNVSEMNTNTEDSCEMMADENINENDSFIVVYRQPVNGYKVKAVVKPDESDVLIMKADVSFEKGGKSFTIHTSCFGDTLFSKGRQDYGYNNYPLFKKHRYKTIEADYPENRKNDEVFPIYMPFFFRDMDFDGVEELVITHYSMSARYHNGYDVYRIVEGEPVLIDYPPYNANKEDWGIGMTDYPEFDYANKTICFLYPEGEPQRIGQIIYGVSMKQKDTIVVNGKKHYFNHLDVIKEDKYRQ